MAKTTTSLASISMTGEQCAACFLVSVILRRVITENLKRSQGPLHADHAVETTQVKFPIHSKTESSSRNCNSSSSVTAGCWESLQDGQHKG
ncbi:unnamed protein product, partial [Bubo scandiacus]